MKKENKKGGSPCKANRQKAPSNGAEKKNRTKISVCQLKRIFKGFAHTQKTESDKTNFELYQECFKKPQNNPKFAKEFLKESKAINSKTYLEQIGFVEIGETERLLKHLGIIQNNKVKIDRLETALKTILLLIRFPCNKDDNGFFWHGIEIRKEQVKALHRFIRGGKI